MPGIGSICTGYGGLDMAAQQTLGGELAWVADPDPGAAAILAHHHPGVPNLGDIRDTDWAQVEPVDVLTAGFPCQDISNAGRRAGIGGGRSGLWSEVAGAIRLLRPRIVVLENVAAVVVRGLDRVAADLAEIGLDAEWTCLPASAVGAPHRRDRWFCLAWPFDAHPRRHPRPQNHPHGAAAAWGGGDAAHPDDLRRHRSAGEHRAQRGAVAQRDARRRDQWGVYAPAIRRWEHVTGRPAPAPTEPGRDQRPRLSAPFVEWLMGLPAAHVTAPDIGLTRTQQLRALGNGVVPQQGAGALAALIERMETTP